MTASHPSTALVAASPGVSVLGVIAVFRPPFVFGVFQGGAFLSLFARLKGLRACLRMKA